MKNQNNQYALKYINKGDICAEVGVWQGHLSTEILEYNPAELHLIDPWVSQDVIKRCYSVRQEKMDKIYENVLNDFGKLNNVKIHRKFSTDVSFPKQYFDWVYIDADHSYDAVKKDLEFYYPLMKKGGYLCGDDYGLWVNKPKKGFGSDGGGGPKPAVDEFVKSHNLEIEIVKNQYVIFV
jgi:hypothetical protein